MAARNKKINASNSTLQEKKKISRFVLILVVVSTVLIILTPIATIYYVKNMTSINNLQKKQTETYEISLETVEVNVSGTLGTRFLRVTPVIEVSQKTMEKYFEFNSSNNTNGRLSEITGILLSIIGDKPLKELLAPGFKQKLSMEITNRLNEYLHFETETHGSVTDVFFTKYLVIS